jgi:RNA-directed DNA polymerase
MDEVSLQLRCKNARVIDADITKYFDTIPHDQLLKAVAKRIVDKHILALIKRWLKAPTVEEKDGKRTYKSTDQGTPQGGVISPLLANIYLNALDVAMKMARLVRDADDRAPRSFTEDEGWPLGAALQGEALNHPKLP